MTIPEQTLNKGLELHMEFGENWLTDIDQRLSLLNPELSKSDLRRIDKLCRKIAKIAHAFIRNNPIKIDGEITFISTLDFNTYLLKEFHWINEENLKQLYSQSCYYALK